jgi:putative lipoprotein
MKVPGAILAAVLIVISMASCKSSRDVSAGDTSVPAIPPPDRWPSVLGKTWILEQIGGQRPIPGSNVTLTMSADGRVSGGGGTNRYFGTWSRDNGSLSISRVGATRMFGDDPPGTMKQEGEFLNLLPTIDGWQLNDDHLVLTREDDDLLVFAPQTIFAVTGTVLYRERIAMPANGTVHVELVDISRQDVPPIVVAEHTIITEGKTPPYPFTLQYDPSKIDSRHVYAVQARVMVNDKVWFTTTDSYLVITNNQGTDLEVVMKRPPAES